MIVESMRFVEIFLSYSHEDEELREKLVKQLSNLKRQGMVLAWHDRNISAGIDWAEEIDAHLNTAQIIVLLLSPDFMASEYCYNVEAQRAMARYEAGEARVIPVLLRPIEWKGVPFQRLQALPTDARPVILWTNLEEALVNVAEGIRQVVDELSQTALLPAVGAKSMPHQRNPLFTDRDEFIENLYTMFHGNKTATSVQVKAISGLGGIGKTQTAAEYAYRHRDDYKAILWASADSHETLVSDFVNIAHSLKLAEKNTKNQSHAVNAVKYWLEHNEGWLLIFDNADDLSVVKNFLPSEGKGHVLMTTREHAIGRMAQRVEIEKMEPEDGANFLLRRAHIISHDVSLDKVSSEDYMKAREIAEVMGGLPLALDQAGAYIEETSCGLPGYLKRYRKRSYALLQRRGEHGSDHPASVVTTWSLSFEKIEQALPAAAELLKFCAFLHPDAIPEEIISEGASELGPILQHVASDPFLLDEAIKELTKFSLIYRYPKTNTLTIHRLVQEVLRDTMDEKTLALWEERAVRAVNRAFPDVEFAAWHCCERCLPHAQICATYVEKWDMMFLEAGRLLNETGNYLEARAQYAQAEPLYQRAQAIYEQMLGSEDPKVAEILKDLASLHDKRGEYALAEGLYKQAQDIREKVLGPKHPSVAEILNRRGLVCYNQGNFNEAKPLYRQALTIDENALGLKHPRMAEVLNNLGWLYYNQARYFDAAPLYQRALEIQENALAKEDPAVAQTLNAQAMLYRSLGDYTNAEQLFLHALAMREQALGKEHPEVSITLNDLAWLYRTQGRYAEAEQLYDRALNIRRKMLGAQHRHVGTVLNDLALLKVDQGKYSEAEPLFQQALAIRERTVGQDHHRLAATLNNLAWLYYNLGKYAQAEVFHKRALQIREKALGVEQPQPYVAQSLNGLGEVYRALGKYAQAEEYHKRALEIREQVFGMEHRHVAMSVNNTGRLYVDQGRYKEAEQFYQRALEIWKKVLGAEHPGMALSLYGLAELCVYNGKYTKAEQLYQQALDIYRRTMGQEHPYVAMTLNGLGWLYTHRGKYNDAQGLLEEAFTIRERVLGAEHPDVATTLNNSAWLAYNQGEYTQAEILYKRVLNLREHWLGAEHPYVAQSLNDMGMLYFDLGKFAQAEAFFQRALTIRRRTLGRKHPLVAQSLYWLAEIFRRVQSHGLQAEAFYKEALGIYRNKKMLRSDHPYQVTILEGYAALMHDTGQEAEAVKLETQADAIQIKHSQKNA